MTGRSREEITSLLSEHKDQFQKMDQKYNAATFKWQNEIAMLERRVHDCYEDVDLGNGDKIAVRTALSEEEMLEYAAIEQQQRQLKQKYESMINSPDFIDEASKLTYRMIELMTANPLITADWLEEHKDRWPAADVLTILVAFQERLLQNRLNKVKDLQSFRTE